MSLFTGLVKVSRFVGYAIVTVLLAALAIALVRLIVITVSDPVADQIHFAAKQEYLSAMPAAEGTPPNIIVILFDDLGWGDLSSYGNQLIKTPNIDAVANQGLRMTNFYSASPVCTPARAALLTGRFPPRTETNRHVFFPDWSIMGIWRRAWGYSNALPREEITLAEVLSHSGYQTGMIGKWHLGDHENHRPNDFGFEYFYGVLFSNDMYPLDLYRNDEVIIEDRRDGSLISAERDELRPLPGEGIDQTKLTEMYTEEAIAFIEKHQEAPFFLYLSHSFPHVPHYASEAHANTSLGGTYGDVVEDLDRSTGALIDALNRLDLADNTIVFITSDNGADYNGSPGPLRGRKGEVREGGQRVPMIVRWPGRIDQAKVSDEMAMSTDIFPTLLAANQLPLPGDRIVDGQDLTDFLTRGAASPHNLLYYFPRNEVLPGAVRDAKFKLLEKTGDFGRNRMHLSRLDADAEAHDLQNLYPDETLALKQGLMAMKKEITANPRGWLPKSGSE